MYRTGTGRGTMKTKTSQKYESSACFIQRPNTNLISLGVQIAAFILSTKNNPFSFPYLVLNAENGSKVYGISHGRRKGKEHF